MKQQFLEWLVYNNQHLDMPHLWGGWIISAKEKCSLTQICEQYLREICVHRKSVRSLSSAHEEWGKKQRCCVYYFVHCE